MACTADVALAVLWVTGCDQHAARSPEREYHKKSASDRNHRRDATSGSVQSFLTGVGKIGAGTGLGTILMLDQKAEKSSRGQWSALCVLTYAKPRVLTLNGVLEVD